MSQAPAVPSVGGKRVISSLLLDHPFPGGTGVRCGILKSISYPALLAFSVKVKPLLFSAVKRRSRKWGHQVSVIIVGTADASGQGSFSGSQSPGLAHQCSHPSQLCTGAARGFSGCLCFLIHLQPPVLSVPVSPSVSLQHPGEEGGAGVPVTAVDRI